MTEEQNIFSNLTIEISSLKAVAESDFTPISQLYFNAKTVSLMVLLLIAALLSFGLGMTFTWSLKTFSLIFVALIGYFLIEIIYFRALTKTSCYSLRQHDVIYKTGVFWHKTMVLPFNRIQHLELVSGPIDRKFQLGSIKFYTAGGNFADLKIPGLLRNDAEEIKAYVTKAIEESQGNA